MMPRWLKLSFVKDEPTELLDLMAESGFMGLGTAYRGNEDRLNYVRAHDGKVELLQE